MEVALEVNRGAVLPRQWQINGDRTLQTLKTMVDYNQT
jgi:hypothetical protein